MTMDEITAALDADPEKARLFEEALRGDAVQKAGNDAEAISLAAAAVGMQITAEEAERFLASKYEADDADLEQVSGGIAFSGEDKNGHDNWCLTVYHCNYVSMHTGGETENTACWSDYLCMGAMHDRCGSGFIRCHRDQVYY